MTPASRQDNGIAVVAGVAAGPIVALGEPLSFWGGVDPATSTVIDVHHPAHGASLAGAVVLMPTSRGSCSGSGVLLELALSGKSPAALIFAGAEDTLTLGAIVASEMFGRRIPVIRLAEEAFAILSSARHAVIAPDGVSADGGRVRIPLAAAADAGLLLSPADRCMLDGKDGIAAQQAMRILVAMASQQGATGLLDVTRAHVDGCIYAGPANLVFAEKMEELGARVRIPTTMNAISVDHANWRRQGVAPEFGEPASRLAETYVRMGCQASFTCAPYALPEPPGFGEPIGWSESNAVIFANSVLGARTAKHPDFLDFCIAVTGRAPLAGAFLDEGRRARRTVRVELPEDADSAAWPLIGYLAGLASPDLIPLIKGLAKTQPTRDDLKALCAAFGTTSAAAMLHIEGITPEADSLGGAPEDEVVITREHLAAGWRKLNEGPADVDLVAIGSPHASLDECRAVAERLDGRSVAAALAVIITAGREVVAAAEVDGTMARLAQSGVAVIPDLCWCSITRPVFPEQAKVVLTNSGKYAHYGPGLSGCAVRLGTLDDCIEAALTGIAPARLPAWLA
ncbi:Predicted aconitase subunit 1 [Bosea sp. 62]|uniref:cis-3-hydroxy-L-proline dehydratase n=1 Tax=unclassified Bosea (in: a-proteobacteria) TaxID=2653178 RepID=UPI001257F379|nr:MULTISPECIES: aconitase family protein [unclassified Bosea (in: a-proteobacteria)]CAD5296067.1 Predicted aconitase subunit 1 [Bosea sp. 21B]CAD5296458.1 Predicted aconitase subunit 1 [Bosea sp. 46]CAD5297618.1 Predicted aconitase subunit 1 [Bosea sp. 7B]VVT61091.1 Predicted aconitase subunit 1 [Bosea sp. EC-HK365B]VXB14329.1 Predicted aconitase subunit 1 [Bosea sp. 125]